MGHYSYILYKKMVKDYLNFFGLI